MDSIGNLSAEQRDLNFAREMVELWKHGVEYGICAFSSIHHATTRLVDHEGQKLSRVLDSPDVLRTYVLALLVEVGEFVQTLDWKPWRKNSRVIDKENTLDEFSDILAFVGVLIAVLNAQGITNRDICDAYLKKERINIDRFEAAMEARKDDKLQ